MSNMGTANFRYGFDGKLWFFPGRYPIPFDDLDILDGVIMALRQGLKVQITVPFLNNKEESESACDNLRRFWINCLPYYDILAFVHKPKFVNEGRSVFIIDIVPNIDMEPMETVPFIG
jgi:hypothetical protein